MAATRSLSLCVAALIAQGLGYSGPSGLLGDLVAGTVRFGRANAKSAHQLTPVSAAGSSAPLPPGEVLDEAVADAEDHSLQLGKAIGSVEVEAGSLARPLVPTEACERQENSSDPGLQDLVVGPTLPPLLGAADISKDSEELTTNFPALHRRGGAGLPQLPPPPQRAGAHAAKDDAKPSGDLLPLHHGGDARVALVAVAFVVVLVSTWRCSSLAAKTAQKEPAAKLPKGRVWPPFPSVCDDDDSSDCSEALPADGEPAVGGGELFSELLFADGPASVWAHVEDHFFQPCAAGTMERETKGRAAKPAA